MVVLALMGGAPAFAESKAALRTRCIEAVDASGARAGSGKLAESAIDLGPSGFLFQFEEAGGGTFFCQICDDTNPAVECGSVGLTLNHRPADGES